MGEFVGERGLEEIVGERGLEEGECFGRERGMDLKEVDFVVMDAMCLGDVTFVLGKSRD